MNISQGDNLSKIGLHFREADLIYDPGKMSHKNEVIITTEIPDQKGIISPRSTGCYRGTLS